MFLGFEIITNGVKVSQEKKEAINKEIVKIIKENGFEIEASYNNTSYPLIKSEIQYRSDNYDDFNMQRKLTEKEINTIANEIFNNYGNLYDDLLDIIDEKIEKLE